MAAPHSRMAAWQHRRTRGWQQQGDRSRMAAAGWQQDGSSRMAGLEDGSRMAAPHDSRKAAGWQQQGAAPHDSRKAGSSRSSSSSIELSRSIGSLPLIPRNSSCNMSAQKPQHSRMSELWGAVYLTLCAYHHYVLILTMLSSSLCVHPHYALIPTVIASLLIAMQGNRSSRSGT